MMTTRWRSIAAIVLATLSGSSATALTTCPPAGPYTQTFETANVQAYPVGPWYNMTLRQEATTSVGGTQVRVHLSDEFAASPVTFGHVSVAHQVDGPISDAPVAVTFNGSTTLTLQPGQEVVSDPVSFPTTARQRLLVSEFLAPNQSISSAPQHVYAAETEYNIVGVDGTMETSPLVNNTYGFTSYLTGLDVDTTGTQTVVAIGDSITDTANAGTDNDSRWTNYLSGRTSLSVVNAGISGNWATNGSGAGPSAVARFQHDVLDVTGVTAVIDADGINDLRNGVSVATLESAQANLVAQAHASGLKFILSTITPCAGDAECNAAGFESARQSYNNWVRSGASGADAVADFDTATRDPANPASLNPEFVTGDHLHPNSAGCESMADAVDITKL
jgi:lysophospholipase L1-like esterase